MKKPFYKTWWFTLIYISAIIITIITLTHNPACKIKGNISSSGEKIYHLPEDQFYDVTKVDRDGEKYFCSKEDAEDNGFRRSLR